jgi:peptidoglycan DL-endopeptidase CwlO
MDSRSIALAVAKQMTEHRNRLAGKAEDAHRAHAALAKAATALAEHRDGHKASAATATSDWNGRNAEAFDRRAGRMTRSLDVTATSAERGAAVVASAASTLDGGHTAVVRLIDEYATHAARALDAGRSAQGAGAQAALQRAIGQVVDLIRNYTGETAKHLAAVQHQLRESAKQLKALERAVEHDGIVDPQRRRPRRDGGARRDRDERRGRPDRKPDRKPGDKQDDKQGTRSQLQNKIRDVARSQLGYTEGAGNANKYGPDAAWCSSFATWVWRKSGVDIPILPFTGDVYRWGQEHGLAYNNRNLDEVRPGDVLLFGSGPQSTSTSTHIGIVESVNGNQVTLIEGNSSDRVQRVTHTLSPSTFYGGVHPR